MSSTSNTENSFYEQEDIWGQKALVYQQETLRDILAILPKDIHYVLDAGCGDGFITNKLPHELDVVGLDISTKALSHVKRTICRASILDIPFGDNTFDLVMCNDVLEHLTHEELQKAVNELCRVSSRYVLITTPLWENLQDGTVKCASCSKNYHINYHKHSFTPQLHRSLFDFDVWKCHIQVLTGDIKIALPQQWQFLSPLLHIPTGAQSFTQCPHCGKNEVKKIFLSDDKQSAQYAAVQILRQSKTAVSMLRTECVSLFGKYSITPIDPGFYDINLGNVEVISEIHFNNEIIFTEESLYRKSFLTGLVTHPYYINMQNYLGGDLDAKIFLLCSFPSLPEDTSIGIIIEGIANQECTLSLYGYFPSEYFHLTSIALKKGSFSRNITIRSIPLTSYGYVMQISSSGPVNLKRIAAGPEDIASTAYKIGKARFRRLPGDAPLLLSLPIYGSHFFDEPWMKMADLLQPNCTHYPMETLIALQVALTTAHYEASSLGNRINTIENTLHTEGEQFTTLENHLDELKKSLTVVEQRLASIVKYLRPFRIFLAPFFIIYKTVQRFLTRYNSFSIQNFKDILQAQAQSPILDTKWNQRTEGKRSYLMICHDQNIDRRIIQEAQTLQNKNWIGILIALSLDQDDHIENIHGITVHRIGLCHIVPACPAYFFAQYFNKLLNLLPSIILCEKIKGFCSLGVYAILRLWYYHSIHGMPLPFDNAFYQAACHYPASLVQAHDLPALKTAATLAEKWGVPLVYDAHEFYPEQRVFSRKQKRLMFDVESRYIKRCQAFFIVNKSLGRIMAQKYGVPEPVELTNALNPPSMLNPDADLFRKEFNLSANDPVILLQGGFAPNRNLEVLVRAMKYLRHPRAVLILMGRGNFGKKLRIIAQKEVPPGKILFKDAVPQEELLNWTCTADIGIIPYPAVDMNTTYCTPNKLFEYIQAGLPILANDLPELRRFVSETGFGQVTRMDKPEAIAAALDTMLEDPATIAQLKTTLMACKNLFSWEQQGEKYASVVESLPTEPRGSAFCRS